MRKITMKSRWGSLSKDDRLNFFADLSSMLKSPSLSRKDYTVESAIVEQYVQLLSFLKVSNALGYPEPKIILSLKDCGYLGEAFLLNTMYKLRLNKKIYTMPEIRTIASIVMNEDDKNKIYPEDDKNNNIMYCTGKTIYSLLYKYGYDIQKTAAGNYPYKIIYGYPKIESIEESIQKMIDKYNRIMKE